MSDLTQRLAGLSPEKRALLLQQLSKQGPAAPKQEIGRRPRPARIPPSFAQQGLWIVDQLTPGSAAYNVPTTMWLRGELDRGALDRALAEMVRRHESLRTVIAADGEGPHQVVLAPSPPAIDEHDLTHLPAGERREAALALARREAARPFDLKRVPLLRAMLARLDGAQHLLVLNAHHIAVDGWSLSVLYTELASLYEAFRDGRPSPLAEPPIQYVDYTLWQHELLAGERGDQQLGYWRERLAGRLPVLELPGDRPRPPVQSHRGAVLRTALPADIYDALKRLARQEGATPFMAFLAGFETLLLRYSGQEDVVVGVGVANRGRPELESLVGFFVNTLGLRCDLSGNPSFRELLGRVKEVTLGAYSHQDLPIERLLADLDLDRALSHSALFQAMLFFQNFPAEPIAVPGLTLTPVELDTVNAGTSRADLTLFVSEERGELALYFEYATDLFDGETVAGFGRHLEQLLRSAVADPSRRLGELEILPAAERRQLLAAWNDTQRELPAEATVHGLFEAQAARTPAAVAVEHDGSAWTYAELDRRAEAVARELLRRGTRRGDLVGLFVERSPDMLAALLGVLKAGAAYVPLDPSYPAERLSFMLEDSAARLVVTERALLTQLPQLDGETLMLEEVAAAEGLPPVKSAVEPADLAYVIFTSGSTGRPKGVQIPHRAVVNFLAAMAREPGLGAADAVCAVTTLSFDIAVLELLLPLSVGARIVLADRATAADGSALARLLASSGTTLMQATPATWRMLLDAGWRGQPGLRILCGGEALPRELADRLLGCGDALWNVYGPTETTVWSALERVTAGDDPISIGRPLDNTEIYVVDRRLQPVPVGVPGELLIGGLGVARGYLARPELTAEKFIPDPFGSRSGGPGGRLYRTGDLARWRRDGRLEVLGRLDNQVKLRGFRIELGEIEAVLAEHPAVRQAVVVCREDRPGDKRLVAYVVPNDGEPPASADLRAFAKTRIPDYMVPSACVVLERLPQTPNGKVDRRALGPPESVASDERSGAPPRNGEEETLVRLWAEVLGVESVGIDEDFFDLGGHSLLATQLVGRIQQAFGGEVPLRLLFEAPTVAGFAERLLRQRAESVDAGDLAGMLEQLESLSDAEIQLLLASEGQQG
jgi:amino acid adenylation domain-containing protein